MLNAASMGNGFLEKKSKRVNKSGKKIGEMAKFTSMKILEGSLLVTAKKEFPKRRFSAHMNSVLFSIKKALFKKHSIWRLSLKLRNIHVR